MPCVSWQAVSRQYQVGMTTGAVTGGGCRGFSKGLDRGNPFSLASCVSESSACFRERLMASGVRRVDISE